MWPSIHYYVLLLSEDMSRLYEGFRSYLIEIRNGMFPLEIDKAANSVSDEIHLKEFFSRIIQHFTRYYEQDPLRLVIVGEKNNLAIFETLKMHRDVLIGKVEGDYIATSRRDLGKIVWPVIKEVMARTNEKAMNELVEAVERKKIVSGIDAVLQAAATDTGSTLYIEEDYHVKGSISIKDHSLIISEHVDILETIDDVADIIIDKVLKKGGTVIFLQDGSLAKLDRIALIRS